MCSIRFLWRGVRKKTHNRQERTRSKKPIRWSLLSATIKPFKDTDKNDDARYCNILNKKT